MITTIDKQDLIYFEQDILECFEHKEIKSPIHLAGGNENELIEIFQDVRPQDWVCTTWRSHYECLLKGVPPKNLKKKIIDGYSISLCFRDYRVISSAIVGGITPIALGLAKAAKEQNKDEKIYCFIGDMSATTGIFFECWNYSVGHDLPIVWIIADNGKSVCTPTQKMWKFNRHHMDFNGVPIEKTKIIYYQYGHTFPHSGGGKHVPF